MAQQNQEIIRIAHEKIAQGQAAIKAIVEASKILEELKKDRDLGVFDTSNVDFQTRFAFSDSEFIQGLEVLGQLNSNGLLNDFRKM
jgi:hypothetical protein